MQPEGRRGGADHVIQKVADFRQRQVARVMFVVVEDELPNPADEGMRGWFVTPSRQGLLTDLIEQRRRR
jgi:hypothetical protein